MKLSICICLSQHAKVRRQLAPQEDESVLKSRIHNRSGDFSSRLQFASSEKQNAGSGWGLAIIMSTMMACFAGKKKKKIYHDAEMLRSNIVADRGNARHNGREVSHLKRLWLYTTWLFAKLL